MCLPKKMLSFPGMYRFVLGGLLCILVSLPLFSTLTKTINSPAFGLGLQPGAEDAAHFFLKHSINGPVFNNYDIGGYLIFSLYPQQKVFIDNRPEAYTTDFFETIYIPAQTNPDAWRTVDAAHHFNVIFFSHLDYTSWGQQFLAARIRDPDWVPVFRDSYAVILVKNDRQNEKLIAAYALPRSLR